LCDSVKPNFSPVYPTFNNKTLRNGQLNLSIRLLANCTDDYYGLFKTDSDTLKLFYLPKGLFPEEFRKGYIIEDGYIPEIKKEVMSTFCDCYFEMTYEIVGLKEIPKFIKINGQRIRQGIYSE
jgi:hypothetical protein